MDLALRTALAAKLGSGVTSARPVAGGDINQAFAVTLADGRRVFVKTNPRSPEGMFAAEATGLAWLAEARAIRVPAVIAIGDGSPPFLALEWAEPGSPASDFDDSLGRSLAALHRAGAPGFGLDRPNFIGRLPQDNTPCPTWPEFYRRRRLEPQIALAESHGLVSSALRREFDRLLGRLPHLGGNPEPPARLHGDLWGGNLHVASDGAPMLIDPAVYGGHREMDLAMMKLFGGFGLGVFEAYDEEYPVAPRWEERVPLWQLYPLLVHVNLFGAAYLPQVERALRALA